MTKFFPNLSNKTILTYIPTLKECTEGAPNQFADDISILELIPFWVSFNDWANRIEKHSLIVL
jgi:hypothetical protein